VVKKKQYKGRVNDWLTPEGLETLKHWARNGLTNDDIAHNMGVSRDTLYRWKKAKSDIYDALKEGRIPADAKVESALHKRATGYMTVEEHEELIKQDDGSSKMVVVSRIRKFVPPDTAAGIFWLKNRDPEHWREQKEIGINGSIKTNSNLDKLSDEDLRKLTKLADDDND
jgi:predicted DNA-binding protein (UPF0251 family)